MRAGPTNHPPSEEKEPLEGWDGSGWGRQGPPVPPAVGGFTQPRIHRAPGALPMLSVPPGTSYRGWTCLGGSAEMDAAR